MLHDLRSAIARAIAVLAGMVMLTTAPATAQQYFTEDARIVPFGTCVFQVWYGQRDSWFEPECTAVPRAELSLGIARVREPGDPAFGRWGTELKVQLRADRAIYVSALAGMLSDPESMSATEAAQAVYAFGAFTEVLGRGRITLIQNLGWVYVTIDQPKHGLLWAARVDGKLTSQLLLVAETAGLSNEHSEYQLGLSALTFKQKLQIDLSYGDAVFTSSNGQGWTIALTVTGPPR